MRVARPTSKTNLGSAGPHTQQLQHLEEPAQSLTTFTIVLPTPVKAFAEIAERQPKLLARHCTEAGLIEKAAYLWGKAGERSLARSALVEAAEHHPCACTDWDFARVHECEGR
jgi:hypothetical protein